MSGGFTTGKALIAVITTEVSAVAGLLIACGLHIRPELRNAIAAFLIVNAPLVAGVWGWLHHNHAKVLAARALSGTLPTTTPAPTRVP